MPTVSTYFPDVPGQGYRLVVQADEITGRELIKHMQPHLLSLQHEHETHRGVVECILIELFKTHIRFHEHKERLTKLADAGKLQIHQIVVIP